ncbi:MAG: DUF3379 family protein [Gammaproteobacteria bacterium]
MKRDDQKPMDPGGSGDEQRFEAMIERALRIDVPASGARAAPRRITRWPLFAVAASLLVAAGMLVNSLYESRFFGGGDLATDVIAHMLHEPQMLVPTDTTVDGQELDKVLQEAGARFSVAPPAVSFVRLCPFRGHMVAHFVVRASHGPVTVLLLPDEQVEARTPLDEHGFVGTILPLDAGGSIAVVGEADEDIEEVRNQVVGALRWRL